MRTCRRGDIVMVSGIAADRPRANGAPYAMGKAAPEALAWAPALEERRANIHVDVVAPGLTVTDMGDRLARATRGVGEAVELDARSPFGRVSRPEDVADVVAFLVSADAGYVTGQRVTVDGAPAGARP